MGTITTLLAPATQPAFLVSQVFFILASSTVSTVGFVTGRVSGGDVLVVIVIPTIALLAAVQIYRRLRAVPAERPFDASDGLLAGMIPTIECVVLLALGAIVF